MEMSLVISARHHYQTCHQLKRQLSVGKMIFNPMTSLRTTSAKSRAMKTVMLTLMKKLTFSRI
jgi:hypothetical protein